MHLSLCWFLCDFTPGPRSFTEHCVTQAAEHSSVVHKVFFMTALLTFCRLFTRVVWMSSAHTSCFATVAFVFSGYSQLTRHGVRSEIWTHASRRAEHGKYNSGLDSASKYWGFVEIFGIQRGIVGDKVRVIKLGNHCSQASLPRPGAENPFTIAGGMDCGMSLAGRKKLINFIWKFHIYLPKASKRRQTRGRETSLDSLSTCLHVMEFRFDAMLCSNLSNKNSDVGHVQCSRGPQIPQPWSRKLAIEES